MAASTEKVEMMRVWLGLLAGVIWSTSLFASELGDIDVAVADRSAEARAEALAAGLDEVLVRLTGHRDLAQLDMLGPLRGQPARWAQRFSYSDDGGQLVLAARFDVNALLQALEKAGAPVWGVTRPQTLVWLVIQRPGMGELLARELSDPLAEALARAAQRRGLPLVLPVMDAAERATITGADIRGHFDQVMFKASQRYDAPLRLAVVLYTGTEPRVRWRLYRGEQGLDQGEFVAADETTAVDRLIDEVADRLAALYVVRGGTGTALSLEVRQIARLEDWDAVQRYLQTLSGVSDVRLEQLEGEQVRFRVVFTASAEQLQRLLALHPHLRPCEAPAAQASAGQPGVGEAVPGLPPYCWRP